ncbi:MAG: hypothetical protein KDI88_01610 [Gammaproteobacteria bacterium]|nr:hypothetical protein [Gammaproteobacteria bacterium]
MFTRVFFVIAFVFPCLSFAFVGHELDVVVSSTESSLKVRDRIDVDRPSLRFEFVLNAGFTVTTDSGTMRALQTSSDGLRTAYRVDMQTPARSLELHYHGRPRFSGRRSMGGMPQGEVSADGLYLDGASAWYPMFDAPVSRYRLRLTLPEDWAGISIGKRGEKDGRTTWSSDQPHDDLYLIAGRFTRHARAHGDITVSVWLLDDDPALADLYLKLGTEYIDHYAGLIGAYPYAKFAVVENRWQTGYGMPSFTLLGSQVLRLPFIPYTSLPHEILHNWWGNGVWVDYRAGNWSEGLTAYLADHWMQERRGEGSTYRLKALQRYSNFAADGEDSALIDFVSRHGDASQSVGYSKSLMLFHDLRMALGDAGFVDALRRLWQRHRFEAVGFEQVVQTLTEGHPELAERSAQWLHRTGAPRLSLGAVDVAEDGDGFRLDVSLQQRPPLFQADVPVAITLDGESIARTYVVRLEQDRANATFRFSRRPVRIDADPGYDVLRYLDPSEQPPALNRLFGTSTLLVLPTDIPPAQREAWQRLATGWRQRYRQLEVADDTALGEFPLARNVLVAGWSNRWRDAAAAAVARHDQALLVDAVTVEGIDYPASSHSSVLVNTNADGASVGFIGAATPDAIAALARKLPHYGSYGRLLFDAANGRNLVKTTLTSEHALLSRQLTDSFVALQLPERAPLAGDAVQYAGKRE